MNYSGIDSEYVLHPLSSFATYSNTEYGVQNTENISAPIDVRDELLVSIEQARFDITSPRHNLI